MPIEEQYRLSVGRLRLMLHQTWVEKHLAAHVWAIQVALDWLKPMTRDVMMSEARRRWPPTS